MSFEPHEIDWDRDAIARYWNQLSTVLQAESYFSNHSGLSIIQFVQKHIQLHDKQILDFGCGRGHLLKHMDSLGIRSDGIEWGTGNEAGSAVPNAPKDSTISFYTELPTSLKADAYDVVFSIEVVEHLLEDDLRATLGELVRVVRPGGHIIITTPNAEDLSKERQICPDCGCLYHRWQHLRSIAPDTLESWLHDHGLKTVVCEGTYFRPPPSRLTRLNEWYRVLRGYPRPTPHLIYIGQKPT